MTLTATRVRMLTPVGGLWPALVTGRIKHIAGSTLGIQSNENAFGIGAGKQSQQPDTERMQYTA